MDKIEKIEKNIIVSINKKEIDRIPMEKAVRNCMTVRSIIMKEIRKSPEIKAVDEFFVHVNGKNVIPRDVKNILIKDVQTIEIFDKDVSKEQTVLEK